MAENATAEDAYPPALSLCEVAGILQQVGGVLVAVSESTRQGAEPLYVRRAQAQLAAIVTRLEKIRNTVWLRQYEAQLGCPDGARSAPPPISGDGSQL